MFSSRRSSLNGSTASSTRMSTMRSTTTIGAGRDRPHDEQAGRLHAARVAAGGLTGIERVHQPLGHRACPLLVGARHVLQHVFAGERVALHRKLRPVTCPA